MFLFHTNEKKKKKKKRRKKDEVIEIPRGDGKVGERGRGGGGGGERKNKEIDAVVRASNITAERPSQRNKGFI